MPAPKKASPHKQMPPHKSASAISSKPKAKAKSDPDDAMLRKHEHHTAMAQKHRAHADLIEAKLRTKGKRIGHVYPGETAHPTSKPPKKKIVPDTSMY
jgi:hypothetical protein